MPEFLVEWRIDITADNPAEAAKKARDIQLNPESIATVFQVIDKDPSLRQQGDRPTPVDIDLSNFDHDPMANGAEIAARAAGWVHGGDGGGIIYHRDHYGSWKEAVSYSGDDGYEDRQTYDDWETCCDMEGIEFQPSDDDPSAHVEDCECGVHSWSDQHGILPAETACTHCGELYGELDGHDAARRDAEAT